MAAILFLLVIPSMCLQENKVILLSSAVCFLKFHLVVQAHKQNRIFQSVVKKSMFLYLFCVAYCLSASFVCRWSSSFTSYFSIQFLFSAEIMDFSIGKKTKICSFVGCLLGWLHGIDYAQCSGWNAKKRRLFPSLKTRHDSFFFHFLFFLIVWHVYRLLTNTNTSYIVIWKSFHTRTPKCRI